MAMALPSAGATATSAAGATAMSMPAAGTVAAPAAGAAALQPALDPAVKFDWEETAPGTHKNDNCQAGVYTGMSLCVFTPANGSAGAPAMPMAGGLQVSAVISIELEKSADGEFLEISGGDFASISFGLFGLRAQLKGSLDCKDLHLTAKTQNGIWALGDPATSPSPGMFDAEFDGTLDPAKGTLAGQWDIYGGLSNTPIGSCAGTWSTNRSP
jgi:hypothetical protein